MFPPITTERLIIRPFVPGDAAALAERRSDPEVARYQDWPTPFPLDKAERIVASLVAMAGPENDEWWMAVVCDHDGNTLGDLSLHLSWGGRSAEVGYSFSPEHWGRGYATEATDALVRYLFEDLPVTRVFGMLDPRNPASAQVLERVGMLFEGHTRSSFWKGDECSDDWIYGMTKDDWDAWRSRVTDPPRDVRLVEVSTENERVVARLKTHKSQEDFVAPMLASYADALFPEVVDGAPLVPWMRAVEADGVVTGFVMLALPTEHHPEPYLWRLLIDRMHQRRGIGSRVLDLLADECRAMGQRSFLTSWEEGKGSPRPFYLAHGFVPTGRIVDDETEARKALAD